MWPLQPHIHVEESVCHPHPDTRIRHQFWVPCLWADFCQGQLPHPAPQSSPPWHQPKLWGRVWHAILLSPSHPWPPTQQNQALWLNGYRLSSVKWLLYLALTWGLSLFPVPCDSQGIAHVIMSSPPGYSQAHIKLKINNILNVLIYCYSHYIGNV
jgi:hypothetical protein